MRCLAVVYLGVIVMLLSVTEQASAAEGDLAKGKALYMKHCAVCHGTEGKGDGYLLFNPPVADLTSPGIKKKSYATLWHSVHDGVQNTAMGAWKFVLSDKEITLVLTYVRSLGR